MDEAEGLSEARDFAPWLDDLARIIGRDSGAALAAETGKDCWRAYFDDGYSPAEAAAEDNSHD